MTTLTHYIEVLNNDCTLYESNKIQKRSFTLDFCRGLAVIFMVFVHVFGIYARPEVYASPLGVVVEFFGSPPAAPVFMLTMGIFFMLSSSPFSLKKGIRRGLQLFILGLILSFLRNDIFMIFESSTYDYAALWEVDILPFAGIAYILLSLIRAYIRKPIYWLLIAIVIMSVSPFVWGITSGNVMVDWLLHFLWSTSELVFFPIFGWLLYPLVGMSIGVLIKAEKSDDQVLKRLYKLGIPLITIGSIISLTNLSFHIGDYYRSGQGGMIWILGFIFIWISLIHNLANCVSENIVVSKVRYWGRETLSIYIIHWLVLSWSTLIIGYENKGYIMTVYLMILILVISHFLSLKIKIRV